LFKIFRVRSRLSLSAALIVLTAPLLSADLIGSWEVDQGPYWPTVPPAYSGQQAAALLFGGSPSDYSISISPTVITFTNWISTWGGACGGVFPCGTVVPQNYVVSTGGLYENPGDTSAYVEDWAIGPQYTNYAFTASAVPEPGFMGLAGVGLAAFALGVLRSRRRQRDQPVH
jgi:hypothetical protein